MEMYNEKTDDAVNRTSAETGIEVTALWAGYSGPVEWSFTYGSLTAGLIPEALRGTREKELLLASDFAQKIGVKQIATHVGFLPENYFDKDFRGTVAVLCRICKVMKARQQVFLFKTGQETPVTVNAVKTGGYTNRCCKPKKSKGLFRLFQFFPLGRLKACKYDIIGYNNRAFDKHTVGCQQHQHFIFGHFRQFVLELHGLV